MADGQRSRGLTTPGRDRGSRRRPGAGPVSELRAWAVDHPGASGFLIVLPVVVLALGAVVFAAATGRSSQVDGVVTAVHLAESTQGSYAQVYVHSPLGDFGSGLPRRSVCRVGTPVKVVVTRDILGVHQSVSLLTPCVSGP